jgi:SAM-dependent methyltransferase
MEKAEGVDSDSIWDKRYKEGKMACTKKVIEKDPIDYTQHSLLYRHAIAKRLTGSLDGNPLEKIAKLFMIPPLRKMLSVGSGMAYAEEWLVKQGFVQHILAYESSHVAVDATRARLLAAGLEDKIEIRCKDVRKDDVTAGSFDAVFVQAAIHHFYEIEEMFQLFHHALNPDGLLIYDEYVGPDHHLYEPLVMEISDEINDCLSDDLRWDALRRETRSCVPRATLDWMLNMDPSEGVHSSRILPLTYKYFHVVYRGDYGGTIMRPFWVGILPNFDFSEDKDSTIARLIVLIEDLLTRYGVIPHYHTRIVGRRRSIPRKDLTQAEENQTNYNNWRHAEDI